MRLKIILCEVFLKLELPGPPENPHYSLELLLSSQEFFVYQPLFIPILHFLFIGCNIEK